MAIYEIGDLVPQIEASTYVASSASVIGNVKLGKSCSVWPQAVLRGDNESISAGDRTNIQDGAVLHADPGFPLSIGANVSVGHQAMLHGCTVGDGTLIGIQAVVLNGAVIGKNCLVAAGAVVTEGRIFPDGVLIIGAPAKAIRELNDSAISNLAIIASEYVERASHYATFLREIK